MQEFSLAMVIKINIKILPDRLFQMTISHNVWRVFGQKYLCRLNLQDGAFDTSGWINQSESEEEALTANYAKGYILGTYE